MSIGVITNMSSLNTQRSLMGTQNSLQTAMARLSSGYRINTAKDDAAGLAISDRMTAQISGLNQAVRNANDGISLAQTAEGAMQESTKILQRIRLLSVQSANDTNTGSDRDALNAEVQQLLAEMQRISETTQFNGQNIIDGTYSGSQFQVGANSAQTIMVNVGNVQTSALGSYQVTNNAAVNGSVLSDSTVFINGVNVGASATSSAEDKAKAINSVKNLTNVSASASTTLESAVDLERGQSLKSGDLVINGVNVGAVAGSMNLATQGANVATAINAVSNQTGVSAQADTGTGKLTLTSSTGKDINITSGSAAGATRVKNASGLNTSTTTSATNSSNTIVFGGTGFQKGVNTITTLAITTAEATALINNNATLTFGGVTFTFVDAAGTVDDYEIGITAGQLQTSASLATAINSAFDAVNDAGEGLEKYDTAAAADVVTVTAKYATASLATSLGGTFTAYAPTAAAGAVTTTALGVAIGDTLNVGGLTYEFVYENTQATGSNVAVALSTTASATVATALASVLSTAITTQYAALKTNIQATQAAGTVTVTSDLLGSDTSNVDVTEPISNGTAGAVAEGTLTVGVDGTQGSIAATGTIELDSAEAYTVTGTAGGLAAVGFNATNFGVALSNLTTVDISTVDGANQAIKLADGALMQIDNARAYLGAVQNRFESVISNLSSVSENLSAARGRIQDADFAAETAQSSKMQILQQSGIAMLVQANQVQQLVLSLLR